MRERFFFGIPLIARSVCEDWPLVQHLLRLTIRSILAQDDDDFRVLLAAHDPPAFWPELAADGRFELLAADWPAEPPSLANDDGGAKKWLVKRAVRQAGGGLLMFLDADDWVGHTLVREARAEIAPSDAGAIVASGWALDYPSLRAARFPIAGGFDGAFHRLCGSSTIGRVIPDGADELARDPHAALGSHHEWDAAALRLGASLAQLHAGAAYVVGTGQNHSERQGPFAAWRRDVTRAVRTGGRPIDAALAARFGQSLEELHGEGAALAGT